MQGLTYQQSVFLRQHAAANRDAAAVSDRKEPHTDGSSHQQPIRAPEPPPHHKSPSNSSFPQSQRPCQPIDTTATVELDVKLRSLVLNMSTDSVCVGIRMMERFQQYQQHAHLWQGRPQVQSPLLSSHDHTTLLQLSS